MKTEQLYKIADKNNIRIDFFPLPKNKSLTVMLDGSAFIGIDNSSTALSAEEKVLLAHELGHCQTGSLYNIYSPLDVRAKHERRADRWAIAKLVPIAQLKKAIKNGITDVPALSEHFGITEEFMKKAIRFYTEN